MTIRARRVLLVALAVVLVVVGVTVAVWWSHRPPEIVVVDPACPALLEDVPNATDDYGDTVEWAGTTYWLSDARARAGDQAGVVSCSVSVDYGDRGWRVAPGPWPDGTATGLPRGTTLHAARGHGADALVARTAKGDRLYCAEDGQDGPPTC